MYHSSILVSLIIALIFTGIFALSMHRDRSRYRNVVFLLFAAGSVLFLIADLMGEAGGIFMLIFAAALLLLVLILPIFLMVNGITMLRREGRKLANFLSLALGIFLFLGEISLFLIGLFLFSDGNLAPSFVDSVKNAAYPALLLLTVTTLYLSVTFLAFVFFCIFLQFIPIKRDFDYVIIHGAGIRKDGTVTRINLALQSHLYRNVMSDGSEVKDLRCRQMILDYVEQFRTAYNRKDIDFLENVFSDDALIITGKAVRRKAGDKAAVLKESPDIVYTQQRKHEYIEKLRTRVFPNNKYIHVTFSDIKVSKHPSIEGYYGVLLRQGYQSSTYSDDGYLFMIWDFRDESHPQIHVRTWQPYWLDEGKTQKIQDDKVFNINSFTIR